MNTIQEELECAKTKMIENIPYNGRTIARLTRNNVAIVEAMIRNDSAYIKSSDAEASPIIGRNGSVKYGGSSAYWMTRLKNYLNGLDSASYAELIKGSVESVDIENSTHLNADRFGRQEIEDRLCRFGQDELLHCLREPEYGDFKLIREIARITSAPIKPRKNLSFASKFCHYACYYIFEGTEWQDNYSIWDSILRKVLPDYLSYFSIEESYDFNNYRDYQHAIDAVRAAAPQKISRNGFDHLLWYYHKSRMSERRLS